MPSGFQDFTPRTLSSGENWGFGFTRSGSNVILAIVQLPTVGVVGRTFEACFNITYGAYPTNQFGMEARISRLDPNNNWAEIATISSGGHLIVEVSSIPSDFDHSQSEWTYNNCGYYNTATGGEYIGLLLRPFYTAVSSLFLGTPNSISLVPHYIKIQTID